MSKRSPAILLVAGLLAVSCSGSPSSEACIQAAADQAFAEQQWQEEFEEHVLSDEALSENPDSSAARFDHDHSAEALFDARVTMIFAEAETRRRCG